MTLPCYKSASWLLAPVPSAFDAVERSLIRSALASLDADQRAVVALRFWLDLSGPEIAHALDIPLGTVHSRLARALDVLRTTIEGPT